MTYTKNFLNKTKKFNESTSKCQLLKHLLRYSSYIHLLFGTNLSYDRYCER